MNILKITSVFLASAAIVAVGANSAQAFTFSIGGTNAGAEGYKSSVAGATTVTFDSPSGPSNSVVTYSGLTNHIVQGSKGGHHATPAGDTSKFLTLAQKGANVAGSTGSLTLNFAKSLDYFGLYWGSVDTYNYVDFYSGNTLLKTFGGGDISTTARGSWTGASDNLFVNFFADPGQTFSKIVLRSNNIAFESDNHAYRVSGGDAAAVPEPFTIGGTLIGLALGYRLKKKQQAMAADE
jgi:hypothetical protein